MARHISARQHGLSTGAAETTRPRAVRGRKEAMRSTEPSFEHRLTQLLETSIVFLAPANQIRNQRCLVIRALGRWHVGRVSGCWYISGVSGGQTRRIFRGRISTYQTRLVAEFREGRCATISSLLNSRTS